MSLTGQVYPSVQFNEEYVKSKAKDTTGATAKTAATNGSDDLNAKITKQGELVRDLKAKKASKEEVTKEVGVLLALKTEFKTLTGQEWKPSATPAPAAASAPAPVASASPSSDLDARITKQGELVRDLKAKKASKVSLLFLSL